MKVFSRIESVKHHVESEIEKRDYYYRKQREVWLTSDEATEYDDKTLEYETLRDTLDEALGIAEGLFSN